MSGRESPNTEPPGNSQWEKPLLRILFVLDDTRPGPMVENLAGLLSRLENLSVRSLVVSLAPHADGTERIQHEDVPVISLERLPRRGPAGLATDVLATLGLRSVIEKFRPLIVHVIGERAELPARLAAAMDRRVKLFVSRECTRPARGLRRVLDRLLRPGLPASGVLFADADQQATWHVFDGFKEPGEDVFGHILDAERIRATAVFGFDRLPAENIYIGVPMDRQQIDAARDMLEAFRILAAGRPELKIVVPLSAGDAVLEPWISDWKLKSQIVYLDDASAWWRALRRFSMVLVHGRPKPDQRRILEAMAVGVPVVCDHTTGLKPWIVEIGGALMRDGEWPRQFAEAAREILNNPELSAALSRAGRIVVDRYVSLPSAARRVRALYAAALKESWVEPVQVQTNESHSDAAISV